jgi:polysaccharide export outer membrane protein
MDRMSADANRERQARRRDTSLTRTFPSRLMTDATRRHGRLVVVLLAVVAAGLITRGFDGLPQREATRPGAVQTPVAAQPGTSRRDGDIQLCQYCEPVIGGVECGPNAGRCGEPRWSDWRPIPWQVFAYGEYVGPARAVHVPEYRLRVDDQLEFVYRFTHVASGEIYRLDVGDELVIESLTDTTINRGDLIQGRGIVIQSDGTITMPILGQVVVAGRTANEVRDDLEERYRKTNRNPTIIVTPLRTNTRLNDLRDAIDSRFGAGGQIRQARVTPEGTVQLPGVGSLPAHGLTLTELQREVEERYHELVGSGVEVTPVLLQRAPRFVYVLGEVVNAGRYSLEGPTSAMQAVALAGGWKVGSNLREIVVFRRTDDWRLMATRLDLRGALLGERPCPADELWLRDSDIVVVPKSPILRFDEFIDLVFTRGIYGVIPLQYSVTRASVL